MRKIYSFLTLMVLNLGLHTSMGDGNSGNLFAQVLIVDGFEDYSGQPQWQTAFGGEWDTTFPGFSMNSNDPCEGNQSARRVFSNTGGIQSSYMEFLSLVATGDDIEVSFEYKIINEATGSPQTGNWGSIVLSYTTDNGANWDTYDTLDQTSPNSATCETHTYTLDSSDVPTGSDFGWKATVIYNTAFTGDYYVYIDNFQAVEQVDCIEPYNIEISNITFDSADVSWEDLNNPAPADGWEVLLCPSGLPISICPSSSDSQTIVSTGSPETFTGLDDGENYDVYVTALCDETNNIVSNPAGPATFQTVAIGTDCDAPIKVHDDPDNPNTGQPYVHSSETVIYDNSYSGTPGVGCGAGGGNYLSGYDVVYHYIPDDDDILKVTVEDLTANDVGVFVYEGGTACDDNIGSFCIGGDSTTSGDDLEAHSLFVDEDADYYIVIASTDGNQLPLNTEYTVTITGFDCQSWEEPDGGENHMPGTPPTVSYDFIDLDPDPGQTLFDFSATPLGVNVTINGATITWYEDNNGAPGNEVTDPLNTIELEDGDCYWVTQTIGACESPALSVCFDEFDCDTQLTGITSTTGDEICEDMPASMVLSASVSGEPDADIFWYSSEIGDEILGVGSQYQTPVLTETTSYWATQVFLGQGNISHQAMPGPASATVASTATDDYGLAFEVDADISLVDVEVFVTGGGVGNTETLEVDLRDASGTVIDTKGFQVDGGSSSFPVANTLPLNWLVEGGNGYRITKKSGPSMLYQTSGSYPYPLGTTGEVTMGITNFGTSNSYYYFYNWTITGPTVLCESDREEVVAEVHEIESTSVSASDTVVCLGDSTQLTVSSTDPNYSYAWSTGQTGSNITVSPIENTTYTVVATSSATGCQYENDIEIFVIETPAVLTMAPEPAGVCIEEFVELTAGGIFEGFEGTTGWTTTNNSSEPDAAWELVSSPYTVSSPNLSENISSNDRSQFYISNSSTVAFGGTLDATLVSPSFSLVSVNDATLDFHHYYKHYALTGARVEASVDNGPWELVTDFTGDQGEPGNFAFESVSLNDYLNNADVRVRFSYINPNPSIGGPGWWWAIDNVTVKRRYTGTVTWDPPANLYLDASGNVPYNTGADAGTVFYGRDDMDGSFTVTATLDVPGCGSISEDITVNVYETQPPVGDTEQLYVEGTLDDLNVTGTGLTWYVLDENGDLMEVPGDTPLEHLAVYYVTQTLNLCESEPLEIMSIFDCPIITDLQVAETTATTATVTWTEPADTSEIEHYRLLVTQTEDGTPVFDELMLVGWDTVTVPGLEPLTEYDFEIYSICDEEVPIYSMVVETIDFQTGEIGIDEVYFEGFSYYPNPTADVVNLTNNRPINRVEIYSLTGQKVLEQRPVSDTDSLRLRLGHLASGTYLARVVVSDAVRVIRIVRE